MLLCCNTTQELKNRQRQGRPQVWIKPEMPSDHKFIAGTYSRGPYSRIYTDQVSDHVAALNNTWRGPRTNWVDLWTGLPDARPETCQACLPVRLGMCSMASTSGGIPATSVKLPDCPILTHRPKIVWVHWLDLLVLRTQQLWWWVGVLFSEQMTWRPQHHYSVSWQARKHLQAAMQQINVNTVGITMGPSWSRSAKAHI